jgi:ribosome-associated protein
LVIDARRFRSQLRNREDALERLIGLIKQAVYRPAKRKKTGLPRKSKRRRLETKRQRGALKRQRRSVSHTEE